MNPSARESALSLAELLATRYGALLQTEAVALAGSHTSLVSDSGSDIDLYVYGHTAIPLGDRSAIAEASATRTEVNNQFWESGDEWLDKATGIHVDVMFRHTHWIEAQLERVLARHEASVGYSTCFWHNVITSEPLIDKRGWFAALQTRAQVPYPEQLRQNIIAKNYPILRDTLSSYLYQLESAVRRGDSVSINHRIAALLASYFDIIFAVNRLPHPGEKRIVQIAEARCQALPKGVRDQTRHLLAAGSNEGAVVEHAKLLVDGLADLLQEQGLLGA